ncbi:MAG: serine/threonine protein kinase [Myxococcaceae bacterium]|nr:serine/threonine protein kinase [Myxococcaceae bacterium]
MLLHSVSWRPMRVIGGRFTLLGRLAFGGMAEVWLARQTGAQGFSRMVVVKRVLEARCSEPEILSMFVEEARLGGQLTHPNIVQTVDFGEDEGVPFIVMEYLFGETLAQVLKTSKQRAVPLPIPLAVHIAIEASQGLSSAHDLRGLDGAPLGIVHRDVSPQNLLVTYDGTVKVLDFGIAKAVTNESHTDQAHVRGRVTYMAPEQMSGTPLDARADVFSLGVVLWEAVTGQPLHPANQQGDHVLMMKLLGSDAPLPSAHKTNPQVPEELDLILARALQKDREHRYSTAAAFRGALQAFVRKQAEPPDNAQVSQLMATLFADRQQERTQVLQRLSTGTATPRWTPSIVDALAPPVATATDPRIDVQVGVETSESPVQRRGRVLKLGAIAAILFGVVAGVGGVWWFTRGPKPTSAPVVVAEAPAPAPPPAAPAPAPPAPPAAAPEPVAAPEAPVAEQAPSPAPARVAVAPPKPKPAAASSGKLRLDTEPWTTVFYKGKKLGDTPLIDVRVPSGQLELLLVNEEAKVRTVIDIEVAPGETTTKRLHF